MNISVLGNDLSTKFVMQKVINLRPILWILWWKLCYKSCEIYASFCQIVWTYHKGARQFTYNVDKVWFEIVPNQN